MTPRLFFSQKSSSGLGLSICPEVGGGVAVMLLLSV